MRKVPKGKRQIAKRDLFYISVGFFPVVSMGVGRGGQGSPGFLFV